MPETKIPDWMEKEVAEYDIDLVEAPKTILDIGANVGAYTLRSLARWPEAKVTAYEPVKANVEGLLANVGERAAIVPAAVRRFSGQDCILKGDMGVTYGFHALGRTTGPDNFVDCISSAELPPADLVKIDTEGCESEILDRLDLSKTKALVCEYHLGDWKEIKAKVEKAGLICFYRMPSSVTHGVLKFAREGTVKPPEGVQTNPIPDNLPVEFKTPDGNTVKLTAGEIRNSWFRPELAGKKLFIGLPINREMPTFFADCMYALQARKPLPLQVCTCQGDGIARSRNGLTSDFLKSDCTHMLMIDCDLVFTADHIVHLLNRNVPLVGGFYPKKQEGPLEWVINTLPGCPPCRRDGMQPLKYIGTGFILIAREVFEKMAAAHPELEFAEDYGSKEKAHDFWSMGPYGTGSDEWRLRVAREILRDTGRTMEEKLVEITTALNEPTKALARYLSEDWYFCQRWLDMGGEVWGDAHVTLQHWGPAIYPLMTQRPEMGGAPKEIDSPSSGAAA